MKASISSIDLHNYSLLLYSADTFITVIWQMFSWWYQCSRVWNEAWCGSVCFRELADFLAPVSCKGLLHWQPYAKSRFAFIQKSSWTADVEGGLPCPQDETTVGQHSDEPAQVCHCWQAEAEPAQLEPMHLSLQLALVLLTCMVFVPFCQPSPEPGLGLDDLQSSLPTPVLLWTRDHWVTLCRSVALCHFSTLPTSCHCSVAEAFCFFCLLLYAYFGFLY